MNNLEIYKEISKIAKQIPVDTGGGCQIPKAALMAKLAIDNNLKTFVEIGVYRGRSFFPMAKAMQITGGHAYGIDPYTNEDAQEDSVPAEFEEEVRSFFASTDFPSIYPEVVRFQQESGLASCSTLLKTTSADAVSFFTKHNKSIDMLHIDGNHDFSAVKEDFINYFPLIKENGFIIFDDTDWSSVRLALNDFLEQGLYLFYPSETFTILQKRSSPAEEDINSFVADERLEAFYYFAENCSLEPPLKFVEKYKYAQSLPTISVLIVSYNHARYLPEALEGILSQTGNFVIEVIVGDDFSTDESSEIIKDYLSLVEQNPFFTIKEMKSEDNLGLEKNYERCFKAVSGEFFAICEGDDYWLSPHKLSLQLSALQQHTSHVLCFNDLLVYEEDKRLFIENINAEWLEDKTSFSITDLIRFNLIGNFSACFYRSYILKRIPDSFFDLEFADWFFNIFAAQWGLVSRIKQPLSVYRRHSGGIWSSQDYAAKVHKLYDLINTYNSFLNYSFDKDFRHYQKLLQYDSKIELDSDLLIIDDSFPNRFSSFRLAEFTNQLNSIPKTKILTAGHASPWSGMSISFDQMLRDFKQEYPGFGDQVVVYDSKLGYSAKAGYCVFLANAYDFLKIFEEQKIPFAFTLYPGGGFGLNELESDLKVKRVFSSPYFQKVIVTQTITRDYLLENGICEENQIELTFGCVIPESLIQSSFPCRTYYMAGKETLDICFAAHKYTQFGLQKGYDVFVEVAHKLAEKYPQMHFHVVGGFDETVFDVQNIRSSIHFYGAVDADKLQEIFKKMDIILAPNMNDLEFSGTFDGFPTASCITAGLSGAAIFCTDPLGLNQGFFVDHEEIEIVPHNTNTIVTVIEDYFHNPEALAKLAARGREKIVQLYSREAQIEPRVAILKQLIADHSLIMEKIENKLREKEGRAVINEMPAATPTLNEASERTLLEQTTLEPGLFNRVKRKVKNALRFIRYAPLIKRSGYFDAEWYTVRNPDVRHSAYSPLHHFIIFGGKEGRDPSPYFNSKRYLHAYPDVAIAGLNPLIHFLKFGRFEGRNPQP